jgi:putative membrane protein
LPFGDWSAINSALASWLDRLGGSLILGRAFWEIAIATGLHDRSLLSGESLDRIENAVADAEATTTCEFIVVLAPASSRYDARVILTGIAAGIITYLLIFWANVWLADEGLNSLLLLLESVAAGVVAWLAFSRVDALKRLVVPHWRRHGAVEDAANTAFTEEQVFLAPERNGVLIYVSVFEGEARVMADIGLRRKLHDSTLGEAQALLTAAEPADPAERVCRALELLATGCRECFPATADKDNEFSDRPQIRMP